MNESNTTQIHAIAKTILNGFERHIYLFTTLTQSAKTRFEHCQWHAIHEAASERTDYFDKRVTETLTTLKQDFAIKHLNTTLWQDIKTCYISLLKNHPQAELAESFYNSVFCHLFERKYYHNNYIFVESSCSSLMEPSASNIYTRFYPAEKGLKKTVVEIINKTNFTAPFPNLTNEVNALLKVFFHKPELAKVALKALTFDILNFTFFRNKGAYIIGRVVSPKGETPFIVSIINDEKNRFTFRCTFN